MSKPAAKHSFTNLYINNIDTSVQESTLRSLCESRCGKVVSLVIIRSKEGASMGYGFCSFFEHKDALCAIRELNGCLVGSKRISVSRAASRSERSQFLRSMRQGECSKPGENSNVYVKGLTPSIREEDLRRMFIQFGPIINVRIMRNELGESRGFGFVSFKRPQDACKAVAYANNLRLGLSVLGVSFYEPKNARRERLAQLHKGLEAEEEHSSPILQSLSSSLEESSESSSSLSPSLSALSSAESSPVCCPSSPPMESSLPLDESCSSPVMLPKGAERDANERSIILSGLKCVSDSKEVCQIFYDFENVKAEPVLTERSLFSGTWKVSFQTRKDADRAVEISKDLYVRNRKVDAKRLL